MLNDDEILRYNRQISLQGFDFDKQEKLKRSRALIIGAGGLGCSCAQFLAASGIGMLTLVDDDRVELSNLHRQILHFEQDTQVLKVDSAKQTLEQINPFVRVHTIAKRLDDQQLVQQISQHDVVIDCSDNVTTRNQLNQGCFTQNTPLISGAAIRMEGQVCTFTYQDDEPCYACLSQLFTPTQLSCSESGVMPAVVGMIGNFQALEAIKLLTGYGKIPKARLQVFDAMDSSWRSWIIPKLPHCLVCAPTHSERSA